MQIKLECLKLFKVAETQRKFKYYPKILWLVLPDASYDQPKSFDRPLFSSKEGKDETYSSEKKCFLNICALAIILPPHPPPLIFFGLFTLLGLDIMGFLSYFSKAICYF